jgi:hypothetical protein
MTPASCFYDVAQPTINNGFDTAVERIWQLLGE